MTEKNRKRDEIDKVKNYRKKIKEIKSRHTDNLFDQEQLD